MLGISDADSSSGRVFGQPRSAEPDDPEEKPGGEGDAGGGSGAGSSAGAVSSNGVGPPPEDPLAELHATRKMLKNSLFITRASEL